MKREYSAGAYIFRRSGSSFKLLMLKRLREGSYDLPKGHIEDGETEEQAAKREIMEEVGLRVDLMPSFRDVANYEYYRDGRKVRKTVVYFIAEVSKPNVRVSEEHSGYLWCDLDDALRHVYYKNFFPHVKRAFEYVKRAAEMRALNGEYEKLPSKTKGWDLSKRFVPGEGPLDAGMMIVGQAPGANEDEQRRPFVGRSGQLLTKVLGEAGIGRKGVYICSVVQFFPPKNRMPSKTEVDLCRGFLARQMGIVKPKVVVLLGNLAGQEVLGIGEVKSNHGRIIVRDGVKYALTLHPAAVLRFPVLHKLMAGDLKSLMKQISK